MRPFASGLVLIVAALAAAGPGGSVRALPVPPAHAEAVDATPVVVLVHGFQGFGGDDATRCLDTPLRYPAETRAFGDLSARLDRAGAAVYVARYRSNVDGTDDLATAAACLGRQIAAVRSARGAPRVVVVGHSMGGIVARRYIEGADYQADVSALVTLGAPHLGIPGAGRLLRLLYPLPYGLDCRRHPGACELFPERMAAFNQRHVPTADVAYRFVGGTRGWLASWLIAGQDDGLVATRSAVGTKLRHGASAAATVHDAHTDFGGFVADHYLASPETAACVLWAAGLRPDPGECGGVDRATPDRDAGIGLPAEATAFTPVSERRLAPGAATEVSLPIDGTHAQVLVGWHGGRPGIVLRAPDGRSHRPSAAGPARPDRAMAADSEPPVGFDEGGVAVFDLPSPEPGTWRLALRSGDGPARLAAFAALESDIRLELTAPRSAPPGAAVALGVRLTGVDCAAGAACRLHAAVGSDAIDSDGRPSKVGGDHRLTLPAPGAPGLHLVTVRAAGTTADGTPFAREVQWVLEVVGGGRAFLPAAMAP